MIIRMVIDMRLNITAKTNKEYVMINTAKLTLPDGNVLTIDRDATEYSIENGDLCTNWDYCYLWAVNDIDLFINKAYLDGDNEELVSILNKGELELELEDDADSDYKVKVEEWFFC